MCNPTQNNLKDSIQSTSQTSQVPLSIISTWVEVFIESEIRKELLSAEYFMVSERFVSSRWKMVWVEGSKNQTNAPKTTNRFSYKLFPYFFGNEKRKRFVFVVGAELRSHQVNMVVLIRQQHRYFQTEKK